MKQAVDLLLSQSIAGGIVIAAVLLIRAVLLRRASARWVYALWLVAAIRLLLPLQWPVWPSTQIGPALSPETIAIALAESRPPALPPQIRLLQTKISHFHLRAWRKGILQRFNRKCPPSPSLSARRHGRKWHSACGLRAHWLRRHISPGKTCAIICSSRAVLCA